MKVSIHDYPRDGNDKCKVYEHGHLRSDRQVECLAEKLEDEFSGKVNIFMAKHFIRKEKVDQLQDYIWRSGQSMSVYGVWERVKTLEEQCSKTCAHDCHESHYFYEITSNGRTDSSETQSLSSITVEHNRLPDVFIRHMPETTFISFVSNFGGLLGMWLGISILSLFDTSYAMFTEFFKTIKNLKCKMSIRIFSPRIENLSIRINLNNVGVGQIPHKANVH